MSVVSAEREPIVSTAIREISHIATLPEITMKIVELVEDPKSTAQDLHKVISNDPALCSRILKVVNSSFYGLPGQIGSINRAIVMLGLNAVKNIAIAASLAKLFRGGELTATFSARDLWTHSNATSAASKMLANALKLGLSDEAFLAGLIHDIGIMVEMQYDRTKLVEVFRGVGVDTAGVPTNDMIGLEVSTFGASHQEFGAGLCEKWRFPKSLALVCGHHHDPMKLPEELRTLPMIVYVADRIAADVAGGFRQDLRHTDIDPAILGALKLTPEKVGEVKNQLKANLGDLASMLG
jgi:HD-like signal output (HDOD) protein